MGEPIPFVLEFWKDILCQKPEAVDFALRARGEKLRFACGHARIAAISARVVWANVLKK